MLKYLSTHWLWHVTNRMAHASMMNCQVGHYRCLISKYLRRVTMLAEVSSNNGPGRCALQCGVLKAHKVLLSCCSNVYKGQDCYKLFTDNCWVYLMAEPVWTGLSSDHPTQQHSCGQQQPTAMGSNRSGPSQGHGRCVMWGEPWGEHLVWGRSQLLWRVLLWDC